MVKERKIKNKRCRYFRAYDVWVADNGWLVAKEITTDKYEFLDIEKDKKGRKYVEVDKSGEEVKLYIDFAVIVCFCKPNPNDGKKYDLNHKDGKIGNDCFINLEWVERNVD